MFDGFFNYSSAVFDTAPLKRLIAKHITADTLRRVSAAHREGRRLYVTTVELESGNVCIWPLSKIAFDALHPASGADGLITDSSHAVGPSSDELNQTDKIDPAGLQRFRQVLLAAAAIPVFFPPVEIDRGLHVDAGLREAISLRLFMLGLHRATSGTDADGSSLKSAGERSADELTANNLQPPTVWAILNGKLRSQPEAVGNGFLSIGTRSLEVYNESVVILSLRDAAHVAATHNPPYQFRWVSEPDDLDAGPGPGLFHSMFDPAVTKRFTPQVNLSARLASPPGSRACLRLTPTGLSRTRN